jgi:hypothetical protein
MGNTNLPQAGAADTGNSRDTLSGESQLTDEEKAQADRHDKSTTGPSPSRPKDAPARIPGQQRDTDTGDADSADDEADQKGGHADNDDSTAFGGHANTGHSPSGAT